MGPLHIDFNVSHSDNFFVLVVADSGSIGVDVEEIKDIDLNMASEFCCDTETPFLSTENIRQKQINFFTLWTLKESYIKAVGLGLSFQLKDVCFDLTDLSSVKIKGVLNKDWSFVVYKEENTLLSICALEKINKKNVVFKELNYNDF